jgi:hypothetical protein
VNYHNDDKIPLILAAFFNWTAALAPACPDNRASRPGYFYPVNITDIFILGKTLAFKIKQEWLKATNNCTKGREYYEKSVFISYCFNACPGIDGRGSGPGWH